MKYRLSCWLLAISLLVLGAAPTFADDAAVEPSVQTSKTFAILASTYIAVNALDVYTTTKALQSGRGVEGNPVLAPIAGNPWALTATKAAMTATSLLLARRAWKRHRVAAITTLVIANVAMGVVVAHNAHVAGGF